MIIHFNYCLISTVVLVVLLNNIYTAPVQQQKQKPVEGESKEEAVDTGLEYDRYLREIVSVLEEDEDFRKKLEAANVSEIKDGSIARHLEFVGHNVRTKLDEIKRREVDRLQELARLKMKQMKGAVRDIRIPGHLDVMNPHSFEMKDLESLITKTTNDLEELDKQRRDEFKEYEMEKQYEEKEKLKHLPEEERKKEEERLTELKKKHGDHEKINHPASKDQFEEVWENTDHLDKEDFNPKTFFSLHDTNGDGVWSIQEVEALLQHELDKAYDEKNAAEDDPVERVEEMNRMREHIFTEIDLNHDKFITRDEFLVYTGPKGDRKEFEENEDWKTLDQDEVFNGDDYQDFLKEHHQQDNNTLDQEQMFSDQEYNDYLARHHAQPGVVNMPHDPSVVNMNIPPQGDQQQYHQQQLAAQQQMLAAQQQQQQAAQQQHAAILQQAQLVQQNIAQQQQQQMAAHQQQLNLQQGQGLHNQGSQGVNPPGMNGVPVQQAGLNGQQQQFQQQQPVVQQGQAQPVQGQQQFQQQQPVVQQGQQQPVVQQGQGQQQPVVQQHQGGQQPVQPNQVHVNQV